MDMSRDLLTRLPCMFAHLGRHCAHIGAPPCLAIGDGVTEASPLHAAAFRQLTPVQGKARTCEWQTCLGSAGLRFEACEAYTAPRRNRSRRRRVRACAV
jgi:hypothetical protein